MCKLLSDSQLIALTEKHHVADSRIPLLIRFLWEIRHLQSDLKELPVEGSLGDRISEQIFEVDCAIATEILRSE